VEGGSTGVPGSSSNQNGCLAFPGFDADLPAHPFGRLRTMPGRGRCLRTEPSDDYARRV